MTTEELRAALDDADNLASCQRDTIGTLTRALHDAADRLGCADYDDVCAAVADALDDAEKREREHVDEANALRLERDRLRVDNVRLLNTIESLSAQLCDTDRGRSEAREEARRLRADNDRLDDAAKGALDDLAAVRRERDEARRDAAKREDAAFADGAAKMQRVVADEILGFVGTIKDNATMTDGAAAETLRRVADLVECLALRIRDMTFEVASALAR
jgi:chromosome segregation ATPase